MGILGPLLLHEGSTASSRVLTGNSGLLLRRCSNKGPHLTWTGESRGLSRVAAGGLGFLSRYHGELREPLVLPQASQVSIRVARASPEVLWSHGRVIKPHFAWKGESPCVSRVAARSVGSPELPWGPEGGIHVVSGKSGIHLSCEGSLGIPLELVQGTSSSSRFEAGNSGFPSSSDKDLGLPMESPLGSQPSFHVVAWNSASLSRWKRGVRPPVELR